MKLTAKFQSCFKNNSPWVAPWTTPTQDLDSIGLNTLSENMAEPVQLGLTKNTHTHTLMIGCTELNTTCHTPA